MYPDPDFNHLVDTDLLEDPDLSGDLDDLSGLTGVTAPPEPKGGQDDLLGEGYGALGGIPDYVRSVKDALALAVGYATSGRTVTPGYCLRETRQYYNVGALYSAAKLSLAGAKALGKAHRVEFSAEGVAKIPRGAIVYWNGPYSQYGHIAPSLGGGLCLSTDWPRGRYGKVNIYTLAKAWGYTEIYWAPCVNDVRVWNPKKAALKKTPKIDAFFNAADDKARKTALKRLANQGDGDSPEEVKAAAKKIQKAQTVHQRIINLRKKRQRLNQTGRQALRKLQVS